MLDPYVIASDMKNPLLNPLWRPYLGAFRIQTWTTSPYQEITSRAYFVSCFYSCTWLGGGLSMTVSIRNTRVPSSDPEYQEKLHASQIPMV